jgi:hypothetical protein
MTDLTNEISVLRNDMSIQIDMTEKKVNKSLTGIMTDLNMAVSAAEEEITMKVNEVKENLEIYITVTNEELSAESHFIKYQIGGIFTLLACLISLWHMLAHIRNINKPSVQRRVLAILLMVPIYSITSWLSLVFPSMEPGLGAFRDCYEAYAIYTFVALLVEILSDGKGFQAAVNVLTLHQLQYLESLHNTTLDSQDNENSNLDSTTSYRNTIDGYDRNEGMQLMSIGEDSTDDQFNDDMPQSNSYKLTNSIGDIEQQLLRSDVQIAASDSENNSLGRNTYATNSLLTASSIIHTQPLKPPCSCACCYDESNPMSVAAAVLDQCQVMALQFVLLKPLLAVIPFILEGSGIPYESHHVLTDNNNIDLTAPKLYVAIVLNLSVAVAFYGLVSFYHATEKELAWCDPWPKFLCIKGVVFMTFWQGIAISGLSRAGFVDAQAAADMQNIVICIEMLLASIMHYLFFPYQEWQDGYKKSKERTMMHLRDTLALKDFVADMKSVIYRSAWDGVRKSKLESNKDDEHISALYNSNSNNVSGTVNKDSTDEQKNLEMVDNALNEVIHVINARIIN